MLTELLNEGFQEFDPVLGTQILFGPYSVHVHDLPRMDSPTDWTLTSVDGGQFPTNGIGVPDSYALAAD